MEMKIQWRHVDENWTKMKRKWGKNCEAKYAIFEQFQNQNGVVFFFDRKIQRK